MKKGEKYKCVSITGGGEEIDEGIWQIKTKTPKTLTVEKITEKQIWDNYERGDEIKCYLADMRDLLRSFRNVLRDWEDGTFTIYPQQDGVPYYFELIQEIKKQK